MAASVFLRSTGWLRRSSNLRSKRPLRVISHRKPLRLCIRAQETENDAKPTIEESQEEELVKRLQTLKQEEETPPATNFWEGVAEEAALIDWPPLGKAVLQTFLVIVIVGTTSLMLFGLNLGLTDLSKWYYSL